MKSLRDLVSSKMERNNIKVFPVNENHPEEEIEETLIRDLKPIFLTSRVFGLTPFLITKTKLSFSKILAIVFGLSHAISYYFLFGHLQDFYHYNLDVKAKILSIAFSIMSSLCIHIDYIVCIVRNQKLHDCLNHIMFYDKAMKFKNENKSKFVAWSWILICMFGILAASVGVLTYQFDVKPLRNAIFYCFGCIFLSIAIFKFLVVVVILLLRFRHLNRRMMKGLLKMHLRFLIENFLFIFVSI